MHATKKADSAAKADDAIMKRRGFMRTRGYLYRASAAWVVGMAMTAAPAIAQTEPAPGTETSDPTDIIVTATKRNENLSQVPIAVSVTTDEDIAAKGSVRPQDYLITPPNVDRKSVGEAQEGSGRLALGGRRMNKTTKNQDKY